MQTNILQTQRGCFRGKNVSVSRHAQCRSQQRGVRLAAIKAVLENGDQNVHRGGHVLAISISKRKLRKLGCRTVDGLDTGRLRNLTCLVSLDNHTLISVLRPGSRQYRKVK